MAGTVPAAAKRREAQMAAPNRHSSGREARLLAEVRAEVRPSFRRNVRVYASACVQHAGKHVQFCAHVCICDVRASVYVCVCACTQEHASGEGESTIFLDLL